VHVINFTNASGYRNNLPEPRGPRRIPDDNLQALEDELIRSRAANCLTIADAAPCIAPNIPSGAFNVVSTEIDLGWVVSQALQAAWKDVPLPGIVMQANPPVGLAQMESWFWVDRRTYEGQVFWEPVHIPVPWTLDWDTLVHHREVSTGPCADDPTRQCTTFIEWDETVHHHEDHLDTVDVTVTLSPVQYAWDFGDDEGDWRAASHLAYSNSAGLGLPYTDPFTASPVAHRYSRSSLDVFEHGGFLVRLTATWRVSAHVRVTRDEVAVQDENRSLQPRMGVYEQRYQVRESQPVLQSASVP